MLTKRQSAILGAIVKEYVDSAVPVGSKVLVEKYNFDLSSATMRNEMSELEDLGYLLTPHTSAGRVPTDKGYRYFVDSLMNYTNLARLEQQKMEKQLAKMRQDLDSLWESTADLLAQMTDSVAITSGEPSKAFTTGISKILKQPEFSSVERACEMAEMFEELSRHIEELEPANSGNEVQVYIGNEHSLTKKLDCAIVFSDFKLKSGKKGRIAILGPARMKYGKNISIVSFLSKLLGGGMGVIFLTILF